jgi:hypothetical protein
MYLNFLSAEFFAKKKLILLFDGTVDGLGA